MTLLNALNEKHPCLIKHLSNTQKTDLEKELTLITDNKVNKFVTSLSKTSFTDTLWSKRNIQIVSIKALLEGKISLNQFATNSMVNLAFNQFCEEFFSVSKTPDESERLKERQIVSDKPIKWNSSLITISKSGSEDFDANLRNLVKIFALRSYINPDNQEAKLDELEAKLSKEIDKMPLSEQSFFSIKIPLKSRWFSIKKKKLEDLFEIAPMLNVLASNKVNLPFLQAKQTEDHIKLIFPSYSIITALLETANPNGVKPALVFGKLGPQDIRNYLLKGKVPINVVLPIAKLINEEQNTQWADGYAAGPFGFFKHDIYHLFIKSMLSETQLSSLQEYINTLVDFRKKLVLVRDGKEEITDDLSAILNAKRFERRFDSYNPEKVLKTNKALIKDEKPTKFMLLLANFKNAIAKIYQRPIPYQDIEAESQIQAPSQVIESIDNKVDLVRNKVIKSIKLLGEDIWRMSDTDFIKLRIDEEMNLSGVYSSLTFLGKHIITQAQRESQLSLIDIAG